MLYDYDSEVSPLL